VPGKGGVYRALTIKLSRLAKPGCYSQGSGIQFFADKGTDMPELILDAFMERLMNSGRVTGENVLELRHNVFEDGVMTRGEAQMLLDIDRAAKDKCAEWAPFLYEAISDYIVHQERPAGYISQDNAVWLEKTLADDSAETTIGLLVHVLENAKSAPESLAAMGLRAVTKSVLANDGDKPNISSDDVNRMRRVLYAFGGEGNQGLTRPEVEALFDLNDKTVEALNDPSWNDLFTKAIANFILCASGYRAPSREDALRQEKWVEDTRIDIDGFFGRMVSGGLSGVIDAFKSDRTIEDAYAEKNTEFEAVAAHAALVEEGEAQWVADRIGRDGVLHDNERSLLQFLKKESTGIHPILQPLLDKVA
jgi:hypothetical protein